MIAAIVVAVIYGIILLRFGRHAFNSSFFFLAGVAAFHAYAIQWMFYDIPQRGGDLIIRGAIPLVEYGEITFLGWLLLLFSLALQLGWMGLGFKMAVDAEYKESTPVGGSPHRRNDGSGAVSPQVRETYGLLHKFLGEQSYQVIDGYIRQLWGSFDTEVDYRFNHGQPIGQIAVVMAAEIWREMLAAMTPHDRERVSRGFSQIDRMRLEDMPVIAEHIAIGIRHATEMADSGQLDSDLCERFANALMSAAASGAWNRA